MSPLYSKDMDGSGNYGNGGVQLSSGLGSASAASTSVPSSINVSVGSGITQRSWRLAVTPLTNTSNALQVQYLDTQTGQYMDSNVFRSDN
jgi:hypothetical protein